jgi:transposase-like protein
MKLGAEVREKWRGLLMEQSQSGQTVSAFCRERGIRDSQFYDWKKRIREGEGAKFVEVKVKDWSERQKRHLRASLIDISKLKRCHAMNAQPEPIKSTHKE